MSCVSIDYGESTTSLYILLELLILDGTLDSTYRHSSRSEIASRTANSLRRLQIQTLDYTGEQYRNSASEQMLLSYNVSRVLSGLRHGELQSIARACPADQPANQTGQNAACSYSMAAVYYSKLRRWFIKLIPDNGQRCPMQAGHP